MPPDPMATAWETQRAAMGAFIRSQREMANMSLRELSRATRVSNAYLSQVERGLHDPTVRVLVQIGDALHLSVEEILRRGAEPGAATEPATDEEGVRSPATDVEAAIALDPVLTVPEKEALRAVYRSCLRAAADRARAAQSGSDDIDGRGEGTSGG